MCNVVTILAATAAITGVASAGMSYIQAQQTANVQEKVYQQQYTQNAQSAQKAAVQNYAAIDQRIVQEQTAASKEVEQSVIEARKAAATTRVAAGEAGISGLSVDALLGDIYGASARHADEVNQQTEWTVQQLQREKEGIASNTQDRINSVQSPVISRPNFLDLGLRIGSTAVDSYSTYKQLKSYDK